MSKILYLARHAHADDKKIQETDYERPLSAKGLNEAATMAKVIKAEGKPVDSLVCSSAVRTATTANVLVSDLDFPQEKINLKRSLYNAGMGEYIGILRNTENSINSILIVGHNPAVSYLAERFTNGRISDFPTCGLVKIAFAVDDWANIKPENAQLEWFRSPAKPE